MHSSKKFFYSATPKYACLLDISSKNEATVMMFGISTEYDEYFKSGSVYESESDDQPKFCLLFGKKWSYILEIAPSLFPFALYGFYTVIKMKDDHCRGCACGTDNVSLML